MKADRWVPFAALLLLVVRSGAGEEPLEPSNDPALRIAVDRVKVDGVVDGDTFRVEGSRRSLRLLHIDTEEKARANYPKSELRALMRSDFPAYTRLMAKDRDLPAKYATPMGEAATRFALKRLPPGTRVQLERDVAGSGLDAYGRTLCHVWALPENGGAPWHYGIEAVRAGMTPYFIKYGRSRRFDAAFRAAQEEARAAHRGIWDPKAEHYPDYEARLAWWTRRADSLDALRRMQTLPDPPIALGGREAIQLLLKRVGDRVRVFGLLDDHDPEAVRLHPKGATLRVGGRYPIEIELTGAEIVAALKPGALIGEFVLVEGKLDREGSPLNERTRYMRIPIRDAGQLTPGHTLPTR